MLICLSLQYMSPEINKRNANDERPRSRGRSRRHCPEDSFLHSLLRSPGRHLTTLGSMPCSFGCVAAFLSPWEMNTASSAIIQTICKTGFKYYTYSSTHVRRQVFYTDIILDFIFTCKLQQTHSFWTKPSFHNLESS